jgi:hypothetical protein
VTRVLTLRELNRTLLARQMLLSRRRVSVVDAVARLVALQAQYAPSPYVALWARVVGFKKEHLTDALVDGRLIKAWPMRGTLHVVTRDLYPFILAAYIESQQGRIANLGTDLAALAKGWPDEPVADAHTVASELLGTDDRWTVAFTIRGLPFLRTPPTGAWPHTKPTPVVLWREALAEPQQGATRVIHEYLAAYGPSTRDDVEHFTAFKIRQIAPALDGLPTYGDEDGRTLYDVPRAPLAKPTTSAPVRFLPAYDSIILAHRDRSRIVPPEFVDAVYNKKNTTTKNTFTVDGFVAGTWRAGKNTIEIEPFERLPRKAREDVERERDALARFYFS